MIRGPGAALWGANAVNGVINIITRKARDTVGTLGGSPPSAPKTAASSRCATAWPRATAMCGVWGKAFSRDRALTLDGQTSNDYWRETRAGFRGDWTIDSTRRLAVSGAVFGNHLGDTWLLPDLTAPHRPDCDEHGAARRRCPPARPP